ncbi:required for excision 1-B domain-containing protein, partial [Dermochelys coriacea]|uniref:required for excision 1-B domain-containing protein n=1 Tax=Dermochelys coriacea TaxID=27794 RepID=UPI001CA94154
HRPVRGYPALGASRWLGDAHGSPGDAGAEPPGLVLGAKGDGAWNWRGRPGALPTGKSLWSCQVRKRSCCVGGWRPCRALDPSTVRALGRIHARTQALPLLHSSEQAHGKRLLGACGTFFWGARETGSHSCGSEDSGPRIADSEAVHCLLGWGALSSPPWPPSEEQLQPLHLPPLCLGLGIGEPRMMDDALKLLLHRFYTLQGERVEAYRLFEEGHRAYLSSGPHYDFLRYRQLVHEITLAFSGISREILEIKEQLKEEHGRPELAQHLSRVQQKEKEKLELTAQLQLARQNVQDQPSVPAHQQEVQELKYKLIKTIEAISEILQDLKYDSEEAE